jgi:hypothetical protein
LTNKPIGDDYTKSIDVTKRMSDHCNWSAASIDETESVVAVFRGSNTVSWNSTTRRRRADVQGVGSYVFKWGVMVGFFPAP